MQHSMPHILKYESCRTCSYRAALVDLQKLTFDRMVKKTTTATTTRSTSIDRNYYRLYEYARDWPHMCVGGHVVANLANRIVSGMDACPPQRLTHPHASWFS
jgi:hypothetical protein|eukprot:COSAG01_NODE_3483_length_6022_cov_36.146041_1_plen_102_part_00